MRRFSIVLVLLLLAAGLLQANTHTLYGPPLIWTGFLEARTYPVGRGIILGQTDIKLPIRVLQIDFDTDVAPTLPNSTLACDQVWVAVVDQNCRNDGKCSETGGTSLAGGFLWIPSGLGASGHVTLDVRGQPNTVVPSGGKLAILFSSGNSDCSFSTGGHVTVQYRGIK